MALPLLLEIQGLNSTAMCNMEKGQPWGMERRLRYGLPAPCGSMFTTCTPRIIRTYSPSTRHGKPRMCSTKSMSSGMIWSKHLQMSSGPAKMQPPCGAPARGASRHATRPARRPLPAPRRTSPAAATAAAMLRGRADACPPSVCRAGTRARGFCSPWGQLRPPPPWRENMQCPTWSGRANNLRPRCTAAACSTTSSGKAAHSSCCHWSHEAADAAACLNSS